MRKQRQGGCARQAEPAAFERFHSLAVRRFLDTRKLREMEHHEIHERLERLIPNDG